MSDHTGLRNAALDLLGGAGVLNNAPPSGPARPAGELAGELRRAMLALKAAAISADGSRVDYAGLRASPAYAAYVSELSPQLRASDLGSLASRAERLAAWINLYNALTIDAVIAFGVRRSVREGLSGLTFFRRAAYLIGGARYSLDDIEHGVLRANAGSTLLPGPQFARGDPRLAQVIAPPDPRIHFALNCASRSCPPIAAYDPARIDAQLDLAARAFVDATTQIDPAQTTLRLSKLFDWYGRDFGGPEGVVRFVLAHLPTDERRSWLAAQEFVDLEFTPYDWALNQ